ncbi:hypothetical protein TNCV_4188271 [Trichonephila clavipes]|nr:hypothetical protein TNCV_4188271 [Trichonephila clavipes]
MSNESLMTGSILMKKPADQPRSARTHRTIMMLYASLPYWVKGENEQRITKSVAQAHRMLSNTYGEAAISERMCREWFERFKNGDFDVKDQLGICGPARRSVL